MKANGGVYLFISALFTGTILLFGQLLSGNAFAAGESDFSFDLHAPYNFGGDLYTGSAIRTEPFYNYIDGKIRELGGISIIRDSGATGIIPKKIPDVNCPPGDTPPCFSNQPAYQWSWIDSIVNHTKNIGSETMMELTLWEMWWDNGGKQYTRDMADINNLLSLTDQAILRYGSTIKYWQIGNEPGSDKWTISETTNINGRNVMLLSYATVEISKKIKAGCPDCKVVLAGVGWWQDDNIVNDYYKRLIEDIDFLGGANSFDVFDFHHHENNQGDTYLVTKHKYDVIRNLLNTHNRPNMPIWITEQSTWSGTPDGYPPHDENTQSGQMIKRYLYAYYSGVKKVFWSPGIIDSPYGGISNGYFSFIGLINKNGTPKMSFNTLKMLIAKLNGFTSVTKIDMGNPDIYLLKFNFPAQDKTPVFTIWKENGETTVNLSTTIGNNITVTKNDCTITTETANQVIINTFPKIIEIKPISISPTPTACPNPPAPSLNSPANGVNIDFIPNLYIDLIVNPIGQQCGFNKAQYLISFTFRNNTYGSGWIDPGANGLATWNTGPYNYPGIATWKAKSRYFDTPYNVNRVSDDVDSETRSYNINCLKGDSGDLNCDGVINNEDLRILNSAWTTTGPVVIPPDARRSPDLNGDNKVDEIDLTTLMRNWTQ